MNWDAYRAASAYWERARMAMERNDMVALQANMLAHEMMHAALLGRFVGEAAEADEEAA